MRRNSQILKKQINIFDDKEKLKQREENKKIKKNEEKEKEKENNKKKSNKYIDIFYENLMKKKKIEFDNQLQLQPVKVREYKYNIIYKKNFIKKNFSKKNFLKKISIKKITLQIKYL
jgi:hypothetical protein